MRRVILPQAVGGVVTGGILAVSRIAGEAAKQAGWSTMREYFDKLDKAGRLWFTGQAGYHGRLDPATGSAVRSDTRVWKASSASSRPWLISG